MPYAFDTEKRMGIVNSKLAHVYVLDRYQRGRPRVIYVGSVTLAQPIPVGVGFSPPRDSRRGGTAPSRWHSHCP